MCRSTHFLGYGCFKLRVDELIKNSEMKFLSSYFQIHIVNKILMSNIYETMWVYFGTATLINQLFHYVKVLSVLCQDKGFDFISFQTKIHV